MEQALNPYLLYLSFGLYLLAGILYLLQWVFIKSPLAVWAFRMTQVSWLLQSALMGQYFYRVGYPFLIESGGTYLFSAWILASAFILLNRGQKLQLLGAFALPLINTFYLLSMLAPKPYTGPKVSLHSPWASFHIMFSFLALAIFSLSFILGILFIIEEFQLKHKILPKLYLKLPSLESLEKVHARALYVGFILLSVGIITGAGWAKSVTGFYFFEDARQLWSIIAWLIYALFLQARFTAGWRGRRGVLLSLLGFVVILFTFLGVEHKDADLRIGN